MAAQLAQDGPQPPLDLGLLEGRVDPASLACSPVSGTARAHGAGEPRCCVEVNAGPACADAARLHPPRLRLIRAAHVAPKDIHSIGDVLVRDLEGRGIEFGTVGHHRGAEERICRDVPR